MENNIAIKIKYHVISCLVAEDMLLDMTSCTFLLLLWTI